MPDSANYIFLPWVQPGVAANIPDTATDTLGANQPGVVSLPVTLVVNAEAVTKTVRLYGPGDVTGIDPQQVVRLEPRPYTNDFEPNYFPAIEFDRPDFPWLFTPAKSDAQGRLRPWLCLVVVRKQEGVGLRPAQPLPVLEITKDELPDLSESWAWAHVQVIGSTKDQLGNTLAGDPAKSVSRLLCPRRLDPMTEYLACVVPTFELGRRAGLHLPIQPANEQQLEPAWLSGAQAPAQITLPVYYSWEFRTGAGDDFEALVQRLVPRALPPAVGKRPMDISQPGFDLPLPPDAPSAGLGLEGALRPLKSASDVWSDALRLPFQSELIQMLNMPWRLATKDGASQDPIVAPPIYGCWQAAKHEVGTTNQSPPAPLSPAAAWPPPFWLEELNLDPRYRVVAGMGTAVVQKEQEQLMASAWEQLGEIEKINQRLRQAQLSRAVNSVYHSESFSRFSDETFMNVIAPVQSRVVLEAQAPNTPAVKTLLAKKLAESFVPSSAISAPLRKLARPRGALNRQFAQAGAPGVQAVFQLFNTADPPTPADVTTQDKGMVTIEKVCQRVQNTGGLIHHSDPPPAGHWELPSDQFRQMLNTFRLSNLSGNTLSARPRPATRPEVYDAAKAHQDYLTLLFLSSILMEFRTVISTPEIKAATLMSLDPARTVSRTVLASVRVNSPSVQTGDELDPIMDAPTFPQPMYEALRDLSQDVLFPGLENVPPNTVALLKPNPKFIEAFLVGLNAEMSRELLWRGYPTDQRGTYFQQFWDVLSAQASPDIPPIHQWGARALGSNVTGAAGDPLVLLIRGELLRRYPNTVIYAVRAVSNGTQHDFPPEPADEVHPIFRGTLEPDVTFLGFNLPSDQAVPEPGWFFVIQQQPTEPRFGLDAAPFSDPSGPQTLPDLHTWDDLNWGHLAQDETALKALSYVSVNNIQLAPTQNGKGVWGRNAAHMAFITRQLPVRIAIHETEILP